MSTAALLGVLAVVPDAVLGEVPVAASDGKALVGLVPVYAFALMSAIATFWWVGRLIASDRRDDDESDDQGGGGGTPRHKPRPQGPFGDGPAPIEPAAPPIRAGRGDVHETPVPRRRRREHPPGPVRAPLGERTRRS